MRQQRLKFPNAWGGKRRGAGRKPHGTRPSEKHKTRARLAASEPVHITLRIGRDLGSLRRRDMFHAIRSATFAVATNETFRIVHLSIQRNHLHLICEAANHLRLARGVQGFAISAARHINRAASKRRIEPRRGAVFPDRYHAHVLKSPSQVRHAVRYVLCNWRHHGEQERPFARTWRVDPFSSGVRFAGWRELEGRVWMWQPPPTYPSLWTWLPKTWLLAHGWRRAGAISVYDVPSEPR